MIGVRFHGPGDLRLGVVDAADPAPAEIRIRPLAVGLCGTDSRIVDGSFYAQPGVVLGHEISGVVEGVGSAVTTPREGDLVTVEPHLFCGHCRYCRLGAEHLCPGKRAFGVHLDGGLAESLTVPARLGYVVPPDRDPAIVCLAEPVACAIHGMDRLAPLSGLPLLIIGAGPAGLILTSLARLAGLGPIVVVEPDAGRRTIAAAMGANTVLDAREDGWPEQALAATHGDGFDFVIEAAGTASGLETAMELSARGARLLVYGVARPGDLATIRPQQVYAKELTILGSNINPFTHYRAVELLAELRLELIDRTIFPLADFDAAFEAQRARAASKVLMAPTRA